MEHLPLIILGLILVLLIGISAFFSGAETGLMAVNRYRIRHLARNNNRKAQHVLSLLEKPDRLLVNVLIGNTFINVAVASISTVIAVHWFGSYGALIATIFVTLMILIFAEAIPKTIAAFYPERVSFVAVIPLQVTLKIFYPFVIIVNSITDTLLKCLRLTKHGTPRDQLSDEEFRTVIHEAGSGLSKRSQTMLLRVLDLKEVKVEDIMVPRSEIIGINLHNDWETIQHLISNSPHIRLPVFIERLDNLDGIIDLRRILPLMAQGLFSKHALKMSVEEPEFVLVETALTTQLLNFQQNKTRMAFVVNEYGDIQGLVTLEDILEEIVGEFAAGVTSVTKEVYSVENDSYLIDGRVYVRDLNRGLGWQLPEEGPRTLSGLITEYLEEIPIEGICLRLYGYPMELLEVKANIVRRVRVYPQFYLKPPKVL